jgi:dienelactone hydrolase
MNFFKWAIGIFSLVFGFCAHAQDVCTAEPTPRWRDIEETCVKLPVTVKNMFNREFNEQFFVTHYKPKGAGPFPLVVMNHGRSGENRLLPARQRQVDVARFWIARGYAVFVPTRLGYGATTTNPDIDPEDSGNCNNKNYAPMMEAAVAHVGVTLNFAKTLSWIKPEGTIIMGQSVGGFTTVAAGAKAFTGVIGGINFAGGSGGDPKGRPNNPCQAFKIGDTMASFAGKSKYPMLWFYSPNDLYWGADHPKDWHKAYVNAGGAAEFVQLPASGDDGHSAINREMSTWHAKVDEWLNAIRAKQ